MLSQTSASDVIRTFVGVRKGGGARNFNYNDKIFDLNFISYCLPLENENELKICFRTAKDTNQCVHFVCNLFEEIDLNKKKN